MGDWEKHYDAWKTDPDWKHPDDPARELDRTAEFAHDCSSKPVEIVTTGPLKCYDYDRLHETGRADEPVEVPAGVSLTLDAEEYAPWDFTFTYQGRLYVTFRHSVADYLPKPKKRPAGNPLFNPDIPF